MSDDEREAIRRAAQRVLDQIAAEDAATDKAEREYLDRTEKEDR